MENFPSLLRLASHVAGSLAQNSAGHDPARPIPLPNDPFRYLLQRDVEIPMDLVPRLRQLGIIEVWVRHQGLEFLEELIDEGLADRQREVYMHVRQNFEAILRDASAEIDLAHLQSSIRACSVFSRLAPAATSSCRSSTPSTTI